MITLGLDPGIARTGYGVLDTSQPHAYVTAGCLETSSSLPPGRRLTILARLLDDLIKRHRIEIVVVEQVYFGRNKTTALTTAQVHGVFLHVIDRHRLPIEYVSYGSICLT